MELVKVHYGCSFYKTGNDDFPALIVNPIKEKAVEFESWGDAYAWTEGCRLALFDWNLVEYDPSLAIPDEPMDLFKTDRCTNCGENKEPSKCYRNGGLCFRCL